MTWQDILVAGVILAIVVAIVAVGIVNKKKGKHSCSCGGSCDGCSMRGSCHPKK